jgi:hypothetical protein
MFIRIDVQIMAARAFMAFLPWQTEIPALPHRDVTAIIIEIVSA